MSQKAKTKVVSNKNYHNSGKPLLKKEIEMIAKLYTSQPTKNGIVKKVRAEFLVLAKRRKTFRDDVTEATIRRLVKALDLEQLRLDNMEAIRTDLGAEGLDKVKTDLVLVDEMILLVAKRLMDWGIEPNFGDLDRLLRVKELLQGKPDSRPADTSVTLDQLVEKFKKLPPDELREMINASRNRLQNYQDSIKADPNLN